MRLTSLTLSNVRNYAHLELEPASGLTVFVGRNAQGKSNLLEAIALLGTGKSFRTSHERDLIRDGFDIAAISGEAHVAAGTVRLGCTVTSTTRGTRKMYAVNGRSVRYASFLGSLRVVTFAPADMHLVGGSPAGRRSFLNVALSQDRRAYYHDLARYQKALAQKSALLRSPEIDGDLLAIYDETLVQAGTGLILARAHYAAALQQSAARAHAAWSGNEQLGAEYQPNVPFEVAAADAVAGAFGARLRASAAQERARQMPLVGPHRDDLRMTLDGRPLAVYGSQGQQRTAVLALKVAEYTVLHERSGEAPLLLLDDVLSELDPERARAFLEGVGAFEQAFVTVTHLPSTMPRGAVYSVENAALTRRDAGTVR